ncbi:MAG: DUF1214 domain-containing protein [Beijerinckiaceae bacterium]
MLAFLRGGLAALIGIALGLGATFVTLERGFGFGAVRAGPWTAWPRAGAADIDPYARAVLSRTGEIPLATAQGVAFYARSDESGASLSGACDYLVTGAVPAARFWTMTLTDSNGRLIENAARRYGFTSSEVLRHGDGAFEIAVASEARPGNWLPSEAGRRFVLVLNLYDAITSASTSGLAGAATPTIKRGRCR